MKQMFVVLVLFASLTSLCSARETMKADADYGVKYVAEEAVSLPQDQSKPYLTIVGSQNDPRYQAVCTWFDRNPTLRSFKDQCHFNTIATQSPHWFERLAPNYRDVPCVRLQDANGSVVAEFVGNSIPMSADALARGLNSRATGWRRCSPILPNDPEPQPLTPGPAPADRHFPFVLLALLVATGGGLGLAKGWHDLYYKK